MSTDCPERSGSNSVSVVVDDRETDSGALRALRDLDGVKVTVQHLPLGDYLVDGRILLPGIGPARAQSLLARFGTIESVLRAQPDDLSAVRGIGPATAQRIRWAVTELRSAYGVQS